MDYECEPRSSLGHPEPVHPGLESVRDLCGQNPVIVIDNVWSREAALAKVREVIAQLKQ